MGGQEALGPSQRRRRRTAGWLVAIGGGLLLIGIVTLSLGASTAAPSATTVLSPSASAPTSICTGLNCDSGGGGSQSPTPNTPVASPSNVGAGSSPWTAANVFGGTSAITGLIAALTGLLAYRASRHQAPPTVYVMASQPPAGAAPGAGLDKAQAVPTDPAGPGKTGPGDQEP
jgi:hypothetical protein